jgi:hypothetical protein
MIPDNDKKLLCYWFMYLLYSIFIIILGYIPYTHTKFSVKQYAMLCQLQLHTIFNMALSFFFFFFFAVLGFELRAYT